MARKEPRDNISLNLAVQMQGTDIDAMFVDAKILVARILHRSPLDLYIIGHTAPHPMSIRRFRAHLGEPEVVETWGMRINVGVKNSAPMKEGDEE